MQQSIVKQNVCTFVAFLKACAAEAALRLIHKHIIESGLESNLFVGNTVIDMYSKCGCLEDAWKVFDTLPNQDTVTWNTIIAGYAQHEKSQEALLHFYLMQKQALEPSQATFVIILKVCSSTAALDQGKAIHTQIVEKGFGADLYVVNTLIDMYTKCGTLKDAQITFNQSRSRDVVTWSVLIGGYAQHGYGLKALQLFQQMQKEGFIPNPITSVGITKACSRMAALDQGKMIHAYIIKKGFDLDVILGNSLVDLYAKCGSLDDACIVFERLPKQDNMSWCAMISGYAHHDNGQEALEFFRQMQYQGMEPDGVTFVGILKACSSMSALDQGKLIHACICESGFEVDIFVGSTVIDMYADCGSLEDACMAFERLPKESVVTWSAMISGCAQHKDYTMALQYFEDMKHTGLIPNDVTFVSLLSASSGVGLVYEGFHWFKAMTECYGIVPTLDHYNCLIDLLGRVGHLCEAEDLLKSLPVGHNIAGWRSLLNHCKVHNNMDIAQRCFDHIVTINHREASGYILMVYMYANAGVEEYADKVEDLRKCANAWKKPAQAFIEVENKVHDFTVGARTYPNRDAVFSKMRRLSIKMKEKGYMPPLNLIFPSLSEDDIDCGSCGDCEKLTVQQFG